MEFAIAGAVRECGGLEILLGMIQVRCVGFSYLFLGHCRLISYLFADLSLLFSLYHGWNIIF